MMVRLSNTKSHEAEHASTKNTERECVLKSRLSGARGSDFNGGFRRIRALKSSACAVIRTGIFGLSSLLGNLNHDSFGLFLYETEETASFQNS